jgi:hypothetical protein
MPAATIINAAATKQKRKESTNSAPYVDTRMPAVKDRKNVYLF